MRSSSRSTIPCASGLRSAAYTAMIGAALVVGSLAPAYAQSAPQTRTGQNETPEQMVGQRIAALHAELKITPAEEQDWAGVAQTMRNNVAAIQKLQAEKASQSQQGMTAVEDLQTYEQFTQTHLDGLKNLTASFQTLYNAMPDQQKKLADQVFENARRQEAQRQG